MKINKLYKKIIMFFGGVYKKKLPKSPEPTMKLGRNVNHDARSLNFPFNTAGLEIKNVTHERYVPIFDQGQIGSCTGNAGIGAISTSPFENKENPFYTRDEAGAVKLYSDATAIDPYNGVYPPNDTGSDGLSIATVLLNNKLISSYQHTFTLQDALKAGSKYSWICGTSWFSDMFNPDPDGRVRPTGSLVGGHEYQLSQIDVDNGRLWFFQSWSDSWGQQGRFYMTWEDFATLLSQNGDVTVLIPPTVPDNTLKTVNLHRIIESSETFGNLDVDNIHLHTLELQWKNNKNNISCIPKGTYVCKWKPFHNTYHYELQDVPGRTGIFIHSGNYAGENKSDVLGCILIGTNFIDINKDGVIDLQNSTVALKQFEDYMEKKDFTLIID